MAPPYPKLEGHDPLITNPPEMAPKTTPRLGDIYTAIDGAPPEWIPSIMARVVSIGLKSGAWSSVDNLISSVQGFAKRTQK